MRRTSNTQVQQKVAAGVQALQTELVRPACAATAVHHASVNALTLLLVLLSVLQCRRHRAPHSRRGADPALVRVSLTPRRLAALNRRPLPRLLSETYEPDQLTDASILTASASASLVEVRRAVTRGLCTGAVLRHVCARLGLASTFQPPGAQMLSPSSTPAASPRSRAPNVPAASSCRAVR